MSYAAKLTKCEAEISLLTAELAAMRERCERLAEMGRAWNSHQYDPSVGTLHRLNVAESACIKHNDLTPPKETSDGQ